MLSILREMHCVNHKQVLSFQEVRCKSTTVNGRSTRYSPKIKFTGKTGYDHMFDFVIPKSKKQPERIIQTINNPKKDAAEALVVKWLDTRETRPPESRLYAFLNDSNITVSQSVIEALYSYDAKPALWSEREDFWSLLAA